MAALIRIQAALAFPLREGRSRVVLRSESRVDAAGAREVCLGLGSTSHFIFLPLCVRVCVCVCVVFFSVYCRAAKAPLMHERELQSFATRAARRTR